MSYTAISIEILPHSKAVGAKTISALNYERVPFVAYKCNFSSVVERLFCYLTGKTDQAPSLNQHCSLLAHLQGSHPRSPACHNGRRHQQGVLGQAPARSSRTPKWSQTSWGWRSWMCSPGCWGISLENRATLWHRCWRWSSWSIRDLQEGWKVETRWEVRRWDETGTKEGLGMILLSDCWFSGLLWVTLCDGYWEALPSSWSIEWRTVYGPYRQETTLIVCLSITVCVLNL